MICRCFLPHFFLTLPIAPTPRLLFVGLPVCYETQSVFQGENVVKKALKHTRSIVMPVFIFMCFFLPIQAVLAGKPVVGVAAIRTAAQNISCQGWNAVRGQSCNRNLAEGFRIMLETAIVKTNKMLVMERSQMEQVMSE